MTRTNELSSDQAFRDNIQARIDAAHAGHAERILDELELNCSGTWPPVGGSYSWLPGRPVTSLSYVGRALAESAYGLQPRASYDPGCLQGRTLPTWPGWRLHAVGLVPYLDPYESCLMRLLDVLGERG